MTILTAVLSLALGCMSGFIHDKYGVPWPLLIVTMLLGSAMFVNGMLVGRKLFV